VGGLIFFLNLFGNNFCWGSDKVKLLQTQVGKTFDNELCGDGGKEPVLCLIQCYPTAVFLCLYMKDWFFCT